MCINTQHTMPLWRYSSSSLPSCDVFLDALCPHYTLAMHVLLLLHPCLQQISPCEVQKAEATPLSLLRALPGLLSYHQSEHVEIQETATRRELREIY